MGWEHNIEKPPSKKLNTVYITWSATNTSNAFQMSYQLNFSIVLNVDAIPLSAPLEEEKKEDRYVRGIIRPRQGRDMMREIFIDGQRIRHTIGDNTWTGTYNSQRNVIIYNNTPYETLSGFAKAHYRVERPDRRCPNSNGWIECKCMINGEWISPSVLRPF